MFGGEEYARFFLLCCFITSKQPHPRCDHNKNKEENDDDDDYDPGWFQSRHSTLLPAKEIIQVVVVEERCASRLLWAGS